MFYMQYINVKICARGTDKMRFFHGRKNKYFYLLLNLKITENL